MFRKIGTALLWIVTAFMLSSVTIFNPGQVTDAFVRWFNIQPSKGKSIKAGWRSDFLRMYQECFNTRLDRRDRIPMHRFENVALMVEVETISKDSKGHSLGKINQYSRVRRCLPVL